MNRLNPKIISGALNLSVNIIRMQLEGLYLKVGKRHAEIQALADYENQKGSTEPQGPQRPLS